MPGSSREHGREVTSACARGTWKWYPSDWAGSLKSLVTLLTVRAWYQVQTSQAGGVVCMFQWRSNLNATCTIDRVWLQLILKRSMSIYNYL